MSAGVSEPALPLMLHWRLRLKGGSGREGEMTAREKVGDHVPEVGLGPARLRHIDRLFEKVEFPLTNSVGTASAVSRFTGEPSRQELLNRK